MWPITTRSGPRRRHLQPRRGGRLRIPSIATEEIAEAAAATRRYFPPLLVQHARTTLRRQVLFGSDFPMITPDRWLVYFEGLDFDEETTALMLKQNAARLVELQAE